MKKGFIDSHCHLNFPELIDRIDDILEAMSHKRVIAALCAGVNFETFDGLLDLVKQHQCLFGSVAVHPGYEDVIEPTLESLIEAAGHDKIVAIGETGLDYHYHKGDLTWQRDRFIRHIHAAREIDKPLIIHCREAADDVLSILKREGAEDVGGVMHCFSESLEVAQKAMDMGFYISFSGVITFKNAEPLRNVAKQIPLDRLLIETDSPYLAPVPYRGKINEPAHVIYVAQCVANLLEVELDTVAEQTTRNFCRLFHIESLA